MNMAFRFSMQQVSACEVQLGTSFPAAYKQWLVAGLGIELEVDGHSWFLHAVSEGRGANTTVVAATRDARSLPGWPFDGICIGHYGAGGLLLLIRHANGEHQLGFCGGRYGQGCLRPGSVASAFRSP